MPSQNGGARRIRRTRFALGNAVEPVERRMLLAVDFTATPGDDTILITANATTTTVTINGTPNVVTVTPGQTINVFAGNGNDTITVNGATLPVTVQGQDGNDAISFTPTGQNLDPVEQQVTFEGGIGSDSAVLNDRANPFDDAFSVDVDLIFRGFFGGLGYSGTTESVTLNLGLGAGAVPGTTTPRGGRGGRGPQEATTATTRLTSKASPPARRSRSTRAAATTRSTWRQADCCSTRSRARSSSTARAARTR